MEKIIIKNNYKEMLSESIEIIKSLLSNDIEIYSISDNDTWVSIEFKKQNTCCTLYIKCNTYNTMSSIVADDLGNEYIKLYLSTEINYHGYGSENTTVVYDRIKFIEQICKYGIWVEFAYKKTEIYNLLHTVEEVNRLKEMRNINCLKKLIIEHCKGMRINGASKYITNSFDGSEDLIMGNYSILIKDKKYEVNICNKKYILIQRVK